ncbi:MAG: hypothetical protein GX660_11895, partial [Clostridiaceae bacterium]|nr:hypothetical protein [Clostridiaceae bacterium]
MKVAVVGGAGKMALGIILDFVENKEVEEILLLDINEELLAARKKELNCEKVKTSVVNIYETENVGRLLYDIDVTVNASSHIFNMAVMDACLIGKSGYTDLGGLYHWALDQLKRNEDFKKAGITGIVGSGSAPGVVSVMAKYGYDLMDTVESVRIYDGITNFSNPGYNFIPPYSLNTIMDEFSAKNYEFKDGRHLEQPAFSGEEE